MLSPSRPPQTFSDATIRRFLLAKLPANQQSAFETALLSSSQLEQRVRLMEIELVDDFAAGLVKASDRRAFRERFLITADREKKLAVAKAFQKRISADFVWQPASQSRVSLFWPRLAWKGALAVLALAILIASALVIRKESPRIVQRFIPRQIRPAPVPARPAETAHHPTTSSDPSHHDESPALPAHEAWPQVIALQPGINADVAPSVSLPRSGASVVRFELVLERTESAAFSIVVTAANGEIVHHVPEFRIDQMDRMDFDVAIERLKAGDYHITLTRLYDEHATSTTYYFRVQ